MNKRDQKITEEVLFDEIREALEMTTEADASESEMTRLAPPKLVLDAAATAAMKVVLVWALARELLSNMGKEQS